jgi:hypothetical protein
MQGLENVFNFASHHMELKSDKWKDLKVTTWPRDECIKSSLQIDGYASSLNAIKNKFILCYLF